MLFFHTNRQVIKQLFVIQFFTYSNNLNVQSSLKKVFGGYKSSVYFCDFCDNKDNVSDILDHEKLCRKC